MAEVTTIRTGTDEDVIPSREDTLEEGICIFQVTARELTGDTCDQLVEGHVNVLCLRRTAERCRVSRLDAGIVRKVVDVNLGRAFISGVKDIAEFVDHIDQNDGERPLIYCAPGTNEVLVIEAAADKSQGLIHEGTRITHFLIGSTGFSNSAINNLCVTVSMKNLMIIQCLTLMGT